MHLNNIRKLIAQHYPRFTTNTNLTMLSYMTLLSFEIDNIIDVIEGVRYQMNSEEIMKLLTK
ncbi:V-type ATPase subunit [Erysipelothrix sp. D19-032]